MISKHVPGNSHHIVLLDLNNESVKNWTSEFYQFWVDPNGDGKFTDGVDGFRIDHIMDDLDYIKEYLPICIIHFGNLCLILVNP